MPTMNLDDFYKEIGETIKAERLKNGMSQEILAEQLELTRASVINLEKGRHRPSVHQLVIIAKTLNVEISSLIPVPTKTQKMTKEILNISEAISDQGMIDNSTENVVLDFLTSTKSQ